MLSVFGGVSPLNVVVKSLASEKVEATNRHPGALDSGSAWMFGPTLVPVLHRAAEKEPTSFSDVQIVVAVSDRTKGRRTGSG